MDSDISLDQQAPIAVITVFLLDYLKRADWFFPSWFNQNSEKINRIVSLVVAFGTTVGLKVVSGDSEHGWNVFIPPLHVLIDTFTHAATQFGGQELLHKLLGNHQMSKELLQQFGTLSATIATQGGANGETKK